MGTLGLLLGLNILPSTWVNSILIVALILSILTIINRCHKGLSQ